MPSTDVLCELYILVELLYCIKQWINIINTIGLHRVTYVIIKVELKERSMILGALYFPSYSFSSFDISSLNLYLNLSFNFPWFETMTEMKILKLKYFLSNLPCKIIVSKNTKMRQRVCRWLV